MNETKKIYPQGVTQDGSLPYDAMATQIIEWRMALVYIRGKLERGEDVDQCAKLMSDINNAIDRMATKLVCSLAINKVVPN